MALAAVTLDDKYTVESGRVFLTGIQALVRLPMMQRRREGVAAGQRAIDGQKVSGHHREDGEPDARLGDQ